MILHNYLGFDIMVNDSTLYLSEGVAKFTVMRSTPDKYGIITVKSGPIIGLPPEHMGHTYIVSPLVVNSTNRTDLIVPIFHKGVSEINTTCITPVLGFYKTVNYYK